MRLYQVRFSSHLVKKFRTIWEHSFSPDTRSLRFGTHEKVSFILPSNENLNSLKHVCQKAVSLSQSSVRSGRRIPLILQALRFHSGFPGSALLLGAIWVFTKMWFPPNILTHLVSCIRWTTIVPHPALDHLTQTQDAHWRISQITQRGELVRSAGGGEQMGINQTGAHFTPSSFPVEPLKDVSPWENSPFLPF